MQPNSPTGFTVHVLLYTHVLMGQIPGSGELFPHKTLRTILASADAVLIFMSILLATTTDCACADI